MDTKEAIIYCEENNIDGDYVECGVYTGNHPALACKTILENNFQFRNIYLYDTFTGLTKPGDLDNTLDGGAYQLSSADTLKTWLNHKSNYGNNWCEESLEKVTEKMNETGYPTDKIIYVSGDVRETLLITKNLPDKISVLRLDTDWYDSTKIELEVLYEKLSDGGVIIIDDYFHWNGQQIAVNEFMEKNSIKREVIRFNNHIGYFIK
jgi:O-methyltransferase